MPDAMNIDAPAECSLWTAKHFMPCAIPAPMGDVSLAGTLSPYTYTTTTGGGLLTDKNGVVIPIASMAITQTNRPDAALASVGKFSRSGRTAELDVVGTKPLIIAAWGPISIVGTIDAGTHRGGRTGGGSDPATLCVGTQAANAGHDEVDTGGGSGGGGGGAFHGGGGMGGPGDTAGQNAGGGGGGNRHLPDVRPRRLFRRCERQGRSRSEGDGSL